MMLPWTKNIQTQNEVLFCFRTANNLTCKGLFILGKAKATCGIHQHLGKTDTPNFKDFCYDAIF
jgi:hypothetical protein